MSLKNLIRDEEIKKLRTGLEDGKINSFQEIADKFNISRQRVHQIIKKTAFVPLRDRLKMWLKELLEEKIRIEKQIEIIKALIELEK